MTHFILLLKFGVGTAVAPSPTLVTLIRHLPSVYIWQGEDDLGVKCFGFDDKIADYWHIYINAAGTTVIESNNGEISFGDENLTTTGIVTMGSPSVVKGTSTGTSNQAYFEFQNVDGARKGWVGDGGTGNNDVTLYSAGRLNLISGGAGNYIYLDSSGSIYNDLGDAGGTYHWYLRDSNDGVLVDIDSDGDGSIVGSWTAGSFSTTGTIIGGGAKVQLTPIGGIAVKLTNTTGVVTIAGQLVKPDPTTDDAVILTGADDTECCGVFLDSGVADDAEAWVVVSGIADVAMEDNTAATRANWISTSGEVGYANAETASPPAAPAHFREIAHCIESVTADGIGTHILARCVLHFN